MYFVRFVVKHFFVSDTKTRKVSWEQIQLISLDIREWQSKASLNLFIFVLALTPLQKNVKLLVNLSTIHPFIHHDYTIPFEQNNMFGFQICE